MENNVSQEFDCLRAYDKEGDYRKRLNAQKANIAAMERKGIHFFISLDLLNAIDLYLIPIVKNGKYGFVNKMAQIVVDPIYDGVKGSFFKSECYVAVKKGVFWSIIDSLGNELLPFKYKTIFPSPDSSLVTCNDYSGWSVVNLKDLSVVVDAGKFELIEGFRFGYARVKNDGKWGIIDTQGELVRNPEFESMYPWYEWIAPTTKVKKSTDDQELLLCLDNLK
jgi:hypothetical protein